MDALLRHQQVAGVAERILLGVRGTNKTRWCKTQPPRPGSLVMGRSVGLPEKERAPREVREAPTASNLPLAGNSSNASRPFF